MQSKLSKIISKRLTQYKTKLYIDLTDELFINRRFIFEVGVWFEETGSWVAHWVERPTLGFVSGPDLKVCGWSPALGSVPRRESG